MHARVLICSSWPLYFESVASFWRKSMEVISQLSQYCQRKAKLNIILCNSGLAVVMSDISLKMVETRFNYSACYYLNAVSVDARYPCILMKKLCP
jgi:hypothetical protein